MLAELFKVIEERKQASPQESYSASLMGAGENRILRKIGEESLEVILAAKGEGDQRLIEESADLIYHLLVLLAHRGLSFDQIEQELASRRK